MEIHKTNFNSVYIPSKNAKLLLFRTEDLGAVTSLQNRYTQRASAPEMKESTQYQKLKCNFQQFLVISLACL